MVIPPGADLLVSLEIRRRAALTIDDWKFVKCLIKCDSAAAESLGQKQARNMVLCAARCF